MTGPAPSSPDSDRPGDTAPAPGDTAPAPGDTAPAPGDTAPPLTNADSAAAFEQHVLPELDLLLRTARSLSGNQADAEDLVQDTLLRAYRAIDRFDGRYPRAWLLTIMRNANINRARKKRPDLLDDPDITFERSMDFADTGTPESVAMEPLFDSAVDAAFARLSPDFRQIVELVDLDGLAYAEAAELLDIPVGTVMSRLHRARKRIRTDLAESGLESERGAESERHRFTDPDRTATDRSGDQP